jgi:hypothetical protein
LLCRKLNDPAARRLPVEVAVARHLHVRFDGLADQGSTFLRELRLHCFPFGDQCGRGAFSVGGRVSHVPLPFVFQRCSRGEVRGALVVCFAGGLGEPAPFLAGVGDPSLDRAEAYRC